jgi:hypothetical protein
MPPAPSGDPNHGERSPSPPGLHLTPVRVNDLVRPLELFELPPPLNVEFSRLPVADQEAIRRLFEAYDGDAAALQPVDLQQEHALLQGQPTLQDLALVLRTKAHMEDVVGGAPRGLHPPFRDT